MERGLIQVYTGDGKGKTTAAVGQAIRALGREYRVMMVQFLKKERGSGEVPVLKQLGAKMLFWGGSYGAKLISGESLQDKKSIIREEGRLFFQQVVRENRQKEYDLLILDEINLAIRHGFIKEEEVLGFLKNKPSSLEVILTGRGAPSQIISMADLVTEMRKIKHPHNQGIKMRRGVEY